MPHIPEQVLSGLRLRFLLITRKKDDLMAVCSNIEAARWFYLEHLWPQDPTELKLPDLKDFICIFLRETPSLKHHLPQLEQVYNDYINYKKTTPTHGGLFLDKEKKKVLLFRDPLINAWDFPKGKVGDYAHPSSPFSRIIQLETGLVITSGQVEQEICGKVSPDETFTFLEVINLSEEEIDPKMLKRIAKWFTVDELEAWKNNEAERTSYERVACFLHSIKLLFS